MTWLFVDPEGPGRFLLMSDRTDGALLTFSAIAGLWVSSTVCSLFAPATDLLNVAAGTLGGSPSTEKELYY